jgi:hypothetical protein
MPRRAARWALFCELAHKCVLEDRPGGLGGARRASPGRKGDRSGITEDPSAPRRLIANSGTGRITITGYAP